MERTWEKSLDVLLMMPDTCRLSQPRPMSSRITALRFPETQASQGKSSRRRRLRGRKIKRKSRRERMRLTISSILWSELYFCYSLHIKRLGYPKSNSKTSFSTEVCILLAKVYNNDLFQQNRFTAKHPQPTTTSRNRH